MRGELEIVGHGYRGVRRRERADVGELLGALVQAPDMTSLLEAPDVLQTILPAGMSARHPGNGEEIRIHLPGGEVWARRFDGLERRAWRHGSEARAAHRGAHRLRALGVPTPAVLGFAEPERGQGPSWTVTEWMDAPTVGELRTSGVLGDPYLRRRCVMGLAEALSRLHGAGWVHGRLHPDRLLVDDAQVLLLDPGSVRRGRRAAQRSELARLAAAFDLQDVGPMERGHFLRRYVGRVPDAAAVREDLARALLRAS